MPLSTKIRFLWYKKRSTWNWRDYWSVFKRKSNVLFHSILERNLFELIDLFDFIYVSVSLYRKLGSVCANWSLLPPLDANPMEKEKKFLNRLTVV